MKLGIQEDTKQVDGEDEPESSPSTAAAADNTRRSVVVVTTTTAAPAPAPATTTAVDTRNPTRGPPSITADGTCQYRDFAGVTEESPLFQEMVKKQQSSPQAARAFPDRLHHLLGEMENQGLADIASWHEHGRSFIIHDRRRFESDILPLWFHQKRVTSFLRQLHIYGFLRIPKGIEKGGYYHELFLRGKPFLSKHIIRIRVKGTKTRKSADHSRFPNFQDFPPVWKVLSDLHGHRSPPGESHPFLSPPPGRKFLKNSSTHDKRGEGKKRTPPRQQSALDMGTPTTRTHASARAPVANQEPSPLLHPHHEPCSGSSSSLLSTQASGDEHQQFHTDGSLLVAPPALTGAISSRERSQARVRDLPNNLMTLERQDESMLIQQDVSLGSLPSRHLSSFETTMPVVVRKVSTLSDGGMLAFLLPGERGLQALDQGGSDHYLLQAGVGLTPLLGPRPLSSSIALSDWPVSNTEDLTNEAERIDAYVGISEHL